MQQVGGSKTTLLSHLTAFLFVGILSFICNFSTSAIFLTVLKKKIKVLFYVIPVK